MADKDDFAAWSAPLDQRFRPFELHSTPSPHGEFKCHKKDLAQEPPTTPIEVFFGLGAIGEAAGARRGFVR